jgi:hypothetical protein
MSDEKHMNLCVLKTLAEAVNHQKLLFSFLCSLILEKGLKQRLLQYATSALLFADKGVNPHLVSWNRY